MVATVFVGGRFESYTTHQILLRLPSGQRQSLDKASHYVSQVRILPVVPNSRYTMYYYLNNKQYLVYVNTSCIRCKIYKSFYEAGRVSFLLSGYKTSERQWKNIQRFSKLM